VAVTSIGQVYTFGSGAYYRLGHGTDDGDALLPTEVEALGGIRIVACSSGRWHTVVTAADTG